MRRKPYSVLLFDEVEKAHSDVMNILLSILDDGRLTDSKGRTVNFSNCIVILTSNLGSEILLQAAQHPNAPGSSPAAVRERVMSVVRSHFRPEFLNRLDDIAIFDPLGPQQLLGVARIQASELATRLTPKNISLHVTDAALQLAVSKAYDAAFGARPLRRWLVSRVWMRPLYLSTTCLTRLCVICS